MNCLICGSTTSNFMFKHSGFDVVECGTCRLARLDPIPSEDVLHSYYKQRSNKGNPAIGSVDRYWTQWAILSLAKKYSHSNNKLFDIGCLDGLLMDIAKANGWDVWGLEYQSSAAEIANEKHQGRIIYADVTKYKNQELRDFDVVTASGVIEHLRDPVALLDTAFSLLKDSGIFVLQTPNYESLPAKLMGRYWFCYAPPEHIFYFSRNNLTLFLNKHGFRVIETIRDWKKLRLGYVYEQLQYFGSDIFRIISKVEPIIPKFLMNAHFRLYGGEMIIIARKELS